MAPDIDELIRKVNTLTLDKNRLRQKLTQITPANGITSFSSTLNHQKSSPGSNGNQHQNSQSSEVCFDSKNERSASKISKSSSLNNRSPGNSAATIPSSSSSSAQTATTTNKNIGGNGNGVLPSDQMIAGVECATSCEEDLLYINELYRKRLDDYDEKWDYIQSECSALLSELNALQEHYAILKREKLELEEQLRSSCDENDRIRSELQTVILNYETQLSAMSEHLSMITSKVNDDGSARQ